MQQSIDLDDVVAFVTLAETGSFALAGRRLGKDPTIVSRRVRALEQRLGIRLAERTTRHVALNEAGRSYLARVRPLLRDLAAADRDAASFSEGQPRGQLRLSLPSSFGRMWLSPLIAEFLERHPAVTVEAVFTNDFVDIIGQEFDLAVRLGVLPDSRLVARKVAPRGRLTCAAPAYLAKNGIPNSPADLQRHACLRYTGKVNPSVWEFRDARGRLESVPIDGPFASDDAEVLMDAAVAGLGLLYASDWLVARHLGTGALVRVLDQFAIPDEGAIYVVTPSGAGVPNKTRAFSDWVVLKLGGVPPWVRENGRGQTPTTGQGLS